MTQVWKDGRVSAVTKVKVDPCFISQIKNQDKDGYQAVQLAFGEKKERRIKKPQLNHLKKAGLGLGSARIIKEFRVDTDDISEISAGDMVSLDNFAEGDIINVTGVSKGKGFAGVVKRHGFHGSKKTHGNKDQLRMPGSAGATGPAHVFKGTRMGGRMGGEQVTTKNLMILGVDQENNILLVSGAIPGSRNSFVFIKAEGDLKTVKPQVKVEVTVPDNGEGKEDGKEESQIEEVKKVLDNDNKETSEEKKESASAEVMADKEEKK